MYNEQRFRIDMEAYEVPQQRTNCLKARMLTMSPTLRETKGKGMLKLIVEKPIHLRKGH